MYFSFFPIRPPKSHLLHCAEALCYYFFGRFEEYIDYMFPEEAQTTNLKILEAAYRWKKQKVDDN